MTEDILNDERMERLAACAAIASEICNGLPYIADEHDADVGMTALILCGFLASKIVGEDENLISKAKFFEQMEMAISAGEAHLTEQ